MTVVWWRNAALQQQTVLSRASTLSESQAPAEASEPHLDLGGQPEQATEHQLRIPSLERLKDRLPAGPATGHVLTVFLTAVRPPALDPRAEYAYPVTAGPWKTDI